MSVDKLQTITSLLCANYDDVKLSPDYLCFNGGGIESRLDAAYIGVGDTTNMFISLIIPTIGFYYKDDDIETDKAMTEIQILVLGCDKKPSKETFEWNDERRYKILPNVDHINVSLYNKKELLVDKNWEDRCSLWWVKCLPPILDKAADEKINLHICNTIKENSTEDQIRSAIKDLVKYHGYFGED